MNAAWLRCPAKLNLILRVCGKRPDGYHEIETVFHAVTLWDELRAERAEPGVTLRIDDQPMAPRPGFAVPADRTNLVCRAAEAFFAATGVRGGVRFQLRKGIPAGGGLGGGSSDAAGALRLLAHLFALPAQDPRLLAIASGLGSDVPFFLGAPTAIGRGRGEILTPVVPGPLLHFVLLIPPFGTSTPEIYRHWRAGTLTRAANPLSFALGNIGSAKTLQVRAELTNDLEAPARSLLPELDGLFRTVAAAGHAGLRLSGSGSTCYLAFGDSDAAEQAADQLEGLLAREQVTVVQVRSVSSDEWARIGNEGSLGIEPGAGWT